MSSTEIKKNTEQKMTKSIDSLKSNLQKIRTGRAHPGILEQINVDYYGNPTPLAQVANLGLADARTLTVQPWEKSMMGAVEKAIRESDLGLNPATQGNIIRVPMPALTEERRKELTKVVKGEGEDSKIAVRNLRRDANESLKKLAKDKEISEDDERRSQDEIQKMTDRFVAEIDKIISEKEKEIIVDSFRKIDYEIAHSIDKHSKQLIVANIELLLKYCLRFYDRQFITRDTITTGIVEKLNHLLYDYLESNKPQTIGTPSVSYCASVLNLSPNYFGDLIKKETGKSAQEFIHTIIIEKAKEKIIDFDKSISQISNELGFKYPHHFTRLFKQKVGITPYEFRSKN